MKNDKTRICPKCKEEIKYWATVCPHCRSKSTPPKIIGYAFLAVLILVIISLINGTLSIGDIFPSSQKESNSEYKREIWNKVMVEPEHFTTLDIYPITESTGTVYLTAVISNKMDYPLPELEVKFDILDTNGNKIAYAIATNDLVSYGIWNYKAIVYTYSKKPETFDVGDIKLADYKFKEIKEYIKIN
uniref:FxLYD domain-containing protein n=1 Tax=Brachyspira catarrhinii TaxID=2528966 RepID=UPI003F4C8585